jgi:glycosyltransferase involved in cell wall biosynthesis
MKVLFLTHIFPTLSDPTAGPYNLSVFRAISRHCESRVMVPGAWWTRSRRPKDLFKAPSENFTGMEVSLPTYWSVPRVPSLHAKGMYHSLRSRIARLHSEFPFDVILAAWAYPDAVAATLLAQDFGCPVVAKILGSDINALTKIPALQIQIRQGLERTHSIVTVSGALRDRVIDLGIAPEKVHAIHNGVNGEQFGVRNRAEARSSLGVSPTRPLVCYVGHLAHEKGADVLMEALHILHSNGRKDIDVAFVGGGDMGVELRERARELKIEDHVRFLGMLPHSEVPSWITACSVLCLPSRREGCPNAVLEALASGRPVVASRVGGVPELLNNENGIMTPVDDACALARGLEAALTRTWDPCRLRASIENLSWNAVGDKYYNVLENAVRDAKHCPSSSGRE